jgi:hypothetical protein
MISSKECFIHQNKIVIKALMDRGYTKENATQTWLLSKSRKTIQDDMGLDYWSGARCFGELEMELANDPDWMTGSLE